MAPAAAVVPGPFLLDHHPGAPHRELDTSVQLQTLACALLPLWHAADEYTETLVGAEALAYSTGGLDEATTICDRSISAHASDV